MKVLGTKLKLIKLKSDVYFFVSVSRFSQLRYTSLWLCLTIPLQRTGKPLGLCSKELVAAQQHRENYYLIFQYCDRLFTGRNV